MESESERATRAHARRGGEGAPGLRRGLGGWLPPPLPACCPPHRAPASPLTLTLTLTPHRR
eukprot:3714545-Rhodomonas_salina.1